METLIAEAGHEDLGLSRALPRAGVFTQFRPASMTCEDLRKVSDLSRGVLLGSVQSSGDRETDFSLFAATMKVAETGFIKGPIDKDELPVGPTLTKRFP